MTLDQLRVFVAVAEVRSVTKAARVLKQTQSAASATIAALEHRHHVKLFDRVGRHIELTEAARRLLPEARDLLARARAVEACLAECAGEIEGELRISSSQTIASHWLPRHLVALRRSHPHVAINLVVNNSGATAEMVHGGAAEVGFIEGPVPLTMLRRFDLAEDQLLVVTAPDHPWSTAATVDKAMIETAEWVLNDRTSGTRLAFEAYLTAIGIAPASLKIALELPTNGSVRAAVQAGMGVTVLSASTVAPSLEEGLLSVAPIRLPSRQFSLIFHCQRALGPAARALVETLGVDIASRQRQGRSQGLARAER